MSEHTAHLLQEIARLKEDMLGEQAIGRIRYFEIEKLKAKIQELEGTIALKDKDIRDLLGALTHEKICRYCAEASCTDCEQCTAGEVLAKHSKDESKVKP